MRDTHNSSFPFIFLFANIKRTRTRAWIYLNKRNLAWIRISEFLFIVLMLFAGKQKKVYTRNALDMINFIKRSMRINKVTVTCFPAFLDAKQDEKARKALREMKNNACVGELISMNQEKHLKASRWEKLTRAAGNKLKIDKLRQS